jgi:SsrA-binding protein
MKMTDGIKVIARNRKASHDYYLEDKFDAGVVLMGSEIKSVRANRVNLSDGFVQEREGELWLMNVNISQYEQASIFGHSDPMRPRKLLLHKREIAEIISRMRERGYTVVPTMMYLQRGKAKVEIALAKGKKLYDKRDAIGKRDADREMRRALKNEY